MIQTLNHSYGSSYFGSGGCYGSVHFSPNARSAGSHDNGFCAGTDAVAPKNLALPARVFATGGDNIGDGREWGEAWEYSQPTGWVRVYLTEILFFGGGRRTAWLAEASDESAAASAARNAAVAAEKTAAADLLRDWCDAHRSGPSVRRRAGAPRRTL